MNRRTSLKVMTASAASLSASAGATGSPIQLHCDLDVDPAKEKEMLANYKKTFQPAIRKQPGFVDVKLLKLRSAVAGKAPENGSYRLLISFQTEDQRKAWVATDLHQKVWPTIESNLKGAKFNAILYDIA